MIVDQLENIDGSKIIFEDIGEFFFFFFINSHPLKGLPRRLNHAN